MNRVDNATATPGGYSDTGDTTITSAIITSLGATGGINVGDYVDVSAGFPDVGRLRVIAKTVNTITVNVNASSTQAGVSVTSKANMFTDGVADTIARTVLNSKNINQIQEELVNLIVAAGLTPDWSNIKQVLNSVVKSNGDIVTGDYDITGFVKADQLKYRKIDGGTEADTVSEVKTQQSQYSITTLAAATTKTLFKSPLTANLYFGFNALLRFTMSGAQYFSAIKTIVRHSDATHTYWVIPTRLEMMTTPSIYGSPESWGSLVTNTEKNTITENSFDGVDSPKNDAPAFILGRDGAGSQHIKIRNTNTSNAITGLEIYLELLNSA